MGAEAIKSGETTSSSPEETKVDTGSSGNGKDAGAVNPEVEGLKQAYEAERLRRQESDQRNAALTKAVEFLQTQAQAQTKASEKGYDPDEIPSVREVQELLSQKEQAIRQEFRSRELERMGRDARKNHTDYDEVLRFADDETRKNPLLADWIMNQADPYEAAYIAGKMSSTYSVTTKSKVTQEVASDLARKLNQPKTLSDVGGGSDNISKTDWTEIAKTDPAKMEAELQRVMGHR